MRTIAELPHPDCKITIFSMNQKFIIKFEQGNLEQTFKIAEMNVTDGVNGLFQILDDEFIKNVVSQFEEMRIRFSEAYDRYE
jgi:hypothetical protein